MKLYLLVLLLLIHAMLFSVTIYDIQYTTDAGSGTYPSTYAGQNVTTSGIVTGTGFSSNHGYFISMPEGGAWKGLYIYDSTHSPALGDLIEITGQVWEYQGWTEMRTLTAYTTTSSGNPLPPVTLVSTSDVNEEAYEGVYVQVNNMSVTAGFNTYSEWTVSDGSGSCWIAGGFFASQELGFTPTVGMTLSMIKGIISYQYSTNRINPRSTTDLEVTGQGLTISIPSSSVQSGSQVIVPINTSTVSQDMMITSFQFDLSYDNSFLVYQGYSQTGTLSSQGSVNVTPNGANLHVNYTGNGMLSGQGALMNLQFLASGIGVAPLTLSNFFYDTEPVTNLISGEITVHGTGEIVIDTLTVIQRPLVTLPAIVLPGEQFQIDCTAPQSTTGWNASLQRGTNNIPMTVVSSSYSQTPPRWVLQAVVPNVPVFEQYDLKVTASAGIADISQKAVSVLPSRRSDYYFVQITDTHLPTTIYYPDSGFDTDSTSLVDLREVINDINIIRPEFILLTGDLINEGEMEDFAGLHNFARAKELLKESEVPVFLVSGNHDIGGWSSTPPPDGSSRRSWWRYFGWSWLNNSSTSYQYHTQDYSFDYGPVHYTGLEAYDNYEDYLPSIYGANSFTNTQLQWLQNDLNASTAATKVLFYHYDFSDQLDLSSLGINMGLWGHIHSDSGSLTSTPYSLALKCCSGNRSYRVIRVHGTTLQPEASTSAGSTGNVLRVSYSPSNNGTQTTVTASAVSSLTQSFPNALIKFKMPHGNSDYVVTNGTLEQVDRSGLVNVCYVRFTLTPNATTTVTITASGIANNDTTAPGMPLCNIYPNPFADSANLVIDTPKTQSVRVSIYNVKGELVKTIHDGILTSGTHPFSWDAKNDLGSPVANGVYFARIQTANDMKVLRIAHIR